MKISMTQFLSVSCALVLAACSAKIEGKSVGGGGASSGGPSNIDLPSVPSNPCTASYNPINLAIEGAEEVDFEVVTAGKELSAEAMEYFVRIADASNSMQFHVANSAGTPDIKCTNFEGSDPATFEGLGIQNYAKNTEGVSSLLGRKVVVMYDSGTLSTSAVDVTTVERTSPNDFIKTAGWLEHKFYRTGDGQYELRLKTVMTGDGDSRFETRMAVRYKLK
jgi:hypothetical protein